MSVRDAIISRLSLGFIWLFTGIISPFYGKEIGYQLINAVGFVGRLPDICIYMGSFTDIIIGIWLFSGRWISACCIVQSMVIIIYTVVLSVIAPRYWLHPFGPLTKNMPILVLIYILYQFETVGKINNKLHKTGF